MKICILFLSLLFLSCNENIIVPKSNTIKIFYKNGNIVEFESTVQLINKDLVNISKIESNDIVINFPVFIDP